ncbi:MAG: hypothetical protein LWW93_12620 [Hyphomicrobiales bacterium]|nr:hypothetical protein [Hyphomicrobiales bacterium]
MRGRIEKTGWLISLRRFGALGLSVFALVFAVGLQRGEALALTIGDEVCVFMGGNLPPRPFPTDPSDLSDHSHDCCDLGLCLAAAAGLPPTGPAAACAARGVLRLRRPRPARRSLRTTKRRTLLPRGPPSAVADAVARGASSPAASRREA